MKNDHVDSGDDIGPRESDHVLVPYNGGHDRQENDITDAAIDLILLKVATCTASASGNKRNGDSMADKKEHKAAASASTKKLEKNLAELKREFRSLSKSVEHHSVQILNMSRFQQRLHTEESLARLGQELVDVREELSAQVALNRRQMADMEALTHEMNALRKLNQNQRNELKQIGTVALGDLQTLKKECRESLDVVRAEAAKQADANQKVSAVVESLQSDLKEQASGLATLAGDVAEQREVAQAQMVSVKQCLAAIMKDADDLKAKLDGFQEASKAVDTKMSVIKKGYEGEINRIDEIGNNHRAAIGKIKTGLDDLKREFSEIRADTKSESERVEEELSKMSTDVGKFATKSADKLVGLERAIRESETKASAARKAAENAVKNLDRFRDESNKAYMNFQSHLSNEVGCCQRALSESVDRARAEQRATREQLAADQQCFFNHIDDLWNREKDRNQNIISSLDERMSELDGMYDDMQERVFEIDRNRKNNLVFYGVRHGASEEAVAEDQDDCEAKIKHIMTTQLKVTREIGLSKVERIWNGPSFRGVKPVLVCFHFHKDKEEVLRRSNLLLRSSSGPNSLYVTEDFSRKVRLHREALVAFAKELRSKDPGARCMLQYDRLHAGGDVYLYNEIEGKVEKALMKKAREIAGSTKLTREKIALTDGLLLTCSSDGGDNKAKGTKKTSRRSTPSSSSSSAYSSESAKGTKPRRRQVSGQLASSSEEDEDTIATEDLTQTSNAHKIKGVSLDAVPEETGDMISSVEDVSTSSCTLPPIGSSRDSN